MNVEYLIRRQKRSLELAALAASREAQCAHRGLAEAYAQRIDLLRGRVAGLL